MPGRSLQSSSEPSQLAGHYLFLLKQGQCGQLSEEGWRLGHKHCHTTTTWLWTRSVRQDLGGCKFHPYKVAGTNTAGLSLKTPSFPPRVLPSLLVSSFNMRLSDPSLPPLTESG